MTIPIYIAADQWRCEQRSSYRTTDKLTKGQVIVADRKPFRVERLAEVPTAKWPEEFVKAWREQNMPDETTWRTRPMRIVGFWEGPGADTRAYVVTAATSRMWSVLPEHYVVCHRCFELPPCRHVHNERIMRAAAEQMEEDMAILPGTCHACREPITKRQKMFTFPGANLVRPDLGDNSAIFHTRSKCYSALRSYDERWARAEPGRTRFFYCEGMLTKHFDGTRECNSPDCLAKGAMSDLVRHHVTVWHRPSDAASRSTDAGCWCLAGQ
jgi:hypothetical protein